MCSLAPNTIAKIVLNFERREEETKKKAIIIRRLSRHDILVKKTLARGDNVLWWLNVYWFSDFIITFIFCGVHDY